MLYYICGCGDNMTYIEFFDRMSVENICACLTNVPERVVMLGDNMKTLNRYAEIYTSLLQKRGYAVEFICRTVNRNNLSDIVEKLTKLVEQYSDCVFGLTGGEDLSLVAAGIVFERFKDKKLQMHRFNIRSNRLYDCDQDGVTIEKLTPALTVDENIQIYGGAVAYEEEKPQGTYVWDIDDEFYSEMNALWDVCKNDVKAWNNQISVFAAAETVRDREFDILTTVASASAVKRVVEAGGGKFVSDSDIVRGLFNAGLLREYKFDGDNYKIKYKNMQIKRCLTKAGLALEMKIFVTALAAEEKGEPVYNDVMNGVCIDWDGKIQDQSMFADTANEIDVIMMKGMVPVFVSCKNGRVDMEELYKLSAVAEKFGGKYAKKVLFAEALDPTSTFTKHIRQRSSDMGIRLVEGIRNMTSAELDKLIKNLWRN